MDHEEDNMTEEKEEPKQAKDTATKSKVAKKATKKERKQAPVNKMGRGKRYLESAKLVDKTKAYALDEAIDLLIKSSTTKFDASAEAHIQTGLDPKQAEQNIRSTVLLPEGSGKSLKILVFAEGEAANEAKQAGADFVGDDDLLEKINSGWLGFDIAVSTPDMMARVGKLGKTLGTKGLMPNPKSGTVTKDVGKAVEEFKKGRVEFKLDKEAIVHIIFGKVSLGPDKLANNFKTLYKAIMDAKPTSAKGAYIKKISIASSMGPGIKVDVTSL